MIMNPINKFSRLFFMLIALVLLGVGIASAAPTSGSNLPGGSPLIIAFTGNKLTLATQGPQDMIFKTNDTTRMTINGTTGAVDLTLAATSLFTTLTGTATTSLVATNTTDTTDNKVLALTGGGAASAGRGGTISLAGNEASGGGGIQLIAGNATTGDIALLLNNASGSIDIYNNATAILWTFNNSGTLVQDATNGGGLFMPRSQSGINRGIVTGLSASTSDIGTAGLTLFDTAGADQQYIVQGSADTIGARIQFAKSRATDGTANTIVVNGDTLGNITFKGANGTTFDNAAQILALSGGTPGASADMPGEIRILVTPDGSATLAEQVRITSSNVNFTGKFTVSSSSDIGWAAVNAANQACNTTCANACVFGMNTGALGNFVGCADATADTCICAGAS